LFIVKQSLLWTPVIVASDVVILNLHLPFVSGADILKRIRADALCGQANAVLFKPISFIQLQNLATDLHTSQTAKPIE
jgi:hypothetical protein